MTFLYFKFCRNSSFVENKSYGSYITPGFNSEFDEIELKQKRTRYFTI